MISEHTYKNKSDNVSFITRRSALYSLGGLISLLHSLFPDSSLSDYLIDKNYHLGACDWSLGYHSDPEALREAKRIGLDGVQVSLGKRENNMHLRQKNVQQQYKKIARETGIKISSLAIGELNQYPYKSDPQTIPWVQDSIEVAKAMNCKVDFKRVHESLEAIDYKGWMQIEGALPSKANRRESYKKNAAFLHKTFEF